MTWFTGVYPSEHRMTNKFAVYNARGAEARQPEGAVARPRDARRASCRQNGYATGGFTGNAGVSGGFGYEQGFDVYYHEPGTFGGFDRSIPEALEWLRANRDRKFFLFLHGYDVHGQNTPGRRARLPLRREGLRPAGTPAPSRSRRCCARRGWRRGQAHPARRGRALLAGRLRREDPPRRRAVPALPATSSTSSGLTDKTLFVLTSDHGTEFYEHRRFDHGFTLYDEQIHVPLFVKLPGPDAGGKVVADRVSSIDVMPTILDLLDVRGPRGVQKQLRGASLVPAMKGEPVAARRVLRDRLPRSTPTSAPSSRRTAGS